MSKYKDAVKTIVICGIIVAIILGGIISFEVLLLKLLGLQYDSVRALLLFFFIYVLLEIPLALITNNIPKALKTVGILKSSKGWLPFILDTGLTYLLITTIDYMMESVMISWQGALIFSLISGIISCQLKENDPERPMIDSKEYEAIHHEIENTKK